MMKKILLLLIFFAFFCFSQTTAKVIGIKDGDTVLVLLGDNIQKTLRLAEVDCPEIGQPFGKNAKQFTSSQIFGKNIEFIETDTDRYSRTIAMIYYDNGKYLSAELIKNGLGWWYYRYSNDENLGVLENEASNNKIGLWSDPNSIPPWEWRKLK
ncbi:MAG: thermonuclease family protein [Chitinophagales bacterium]|nr:thermonuclease family protein [Chitinophagales bacterium]